jgi:DNA-binding PadR family transcriptional regulator
MEAFLLFEVAIRATYGYELAQRMGDWGFRRAAADASVVYKVLRGLEAHGLVRSEWAISADGPPRRLYALTPAGERSLHEYATDLTRSVERTQAFLERYHQHFPTPPPRLAEANDEGRRADDRTRAR